ncbi:MAG: ATP-binding protein [Ignavibacteria bacterium]
MEIGFEENDEKKIELLLIEDNIHDARMFSENLTGNYNDEFKITHTSNVKAGIENISRKSFDIIVADLNLPDSSGISTFYEIKKRSGNTPVIILSGMNDSNLTLESIRSGAQDYIYKGNYEGDFIYRVVRHAIQREKLFREIEERTIRLIKLNKSLQELNFNKDRMNSIISHDLINPVNALKGYTEMLHESFNELTNEEKKETVATINELTQEVSHLLKNLLLWSAANTRHIDYKPEKLNIASLLKEQSEFFKLTASNKEITIINETAEMYVMADKNMIETVVRNIVSNAIKFTNPSGKIIIKNFLKKDKVAVSIEDTGIGMEKDEVDKLFKAEQNFSNQGTNKEKGIGLGLLICKEFIKRHNGKIEVASKKNVGTSFIITLPKAEA